MLSLCWQGRIRVGELWRSSGLEWSDFLGPKENVQGFIKEHVSVHICPLFSVLLKTMQL